MPLFFSSVAQQVFFWIFLTLFAAAAICALVFSVQNKMTQLAAGQSAAMFFLGLAFVCLIPRSPAVYLACFLNGFAGWGDRFEKFAPKFAALSASSTAQGLLILQICLLFRHPKPAFLFASLLPFAIALTALAIVTGKKRALGVSFRISDCASHLPGLIFSVVLLVDRFYYAGFLLLAGMIEWTWGKAVSLQKGENHSRAFFSTAVSLIGFLLIDLGIFLYFTI